MKKATDYQQLLKGGYGHSGRIGYLSPGIIDETLSGQWYRMAPPGVTLVRTSLGLKDVTVEEVKSAVARTEKASAELGTFVISSLQASLWKALQIIKYETPVEGYGRLLRGSPR